MSRQKSRLFPFPAFLIHFPFSTPFASVFAHTVVIEYVDYCAIERFHCKWTEVLRIPFKSPLEGLRTEARSILFPSAFGSVLALATLFSPAKTIRWRSFHALATLSGNTREPRRTFPSRALTFKGLVSVSERNDGRASPLSLENVGGSSLSVRCADGKSPLLLWAVCDGNVRLARFFRKFLFSERAQIRKGSSSSSPAAHLLSSACGALPSK